MAVTIGLHKTSATAEIASSRMRHVYLKVEDMLFGLGIGHSVIQ